MLASPHSGRRYEPEFLAASRLDPQTLRRSEDCFVDQIFGQGPELGAPLIRALFPRAWLDANREPWELDPEMFEDALPDYVNSRSPRVAAGLGTIARVVAQGHEIYRSKLRFADALERVNRCYTPITPRSPAWSTRPPGVRPVLLIDCHSMPSRAPRAPLRRPPGRLRARRLLRQLLRRRGDRRPSNG